MLEETDIKKLSEALATKADFDALRGEVKQLAFDQTRLDVHVIKLETRMELRMDRFDTRMDELMTAVDGIAASIDDLRHEYIAIKLQLDRHEKWIKEIAQKTGVVLSAT